jgi:hypothetical protein
MDKVFTVHKGDEFHLTITDDLGHQVLVREEIHVNTYIDFIAAYRFINEDGTCNGYHLAGIFGQRDALPDEIKNALTWDQLTKQQQKNLIKTVGLKRKQPESLLQKIKRTLGWNNG